MNIYKIVVAILIVLLTIAPGVIMVIDKKQWTRGDDGMEPHPISIALIITGVFLLVMMLIESI